MSSYSSNKSIQNSAADSFNFYSYDSTTLTYPLQTVTSRLQNLSLQVGAPTILILVTIAAICCIFLVKRLVDHRRHALMEAPDNRMLENGIQEIGLQTVPTYGQYLNSLRIDGCSQLPSQQAAIPPHSEISLDLPPSYDTATKHSTQNAALPLSIADTGYAASESCLVLPPSYTEATQDLSSVPRNATVASAASLHETIAVEPNVGSCNVATHEVPRTSTAPNSQGTSVEIRIQGTATLS